MNSVFKTILISSFSVFFILTGEVFANVKIVATVNSTFITRVDLENRVKFLAAVSGQKMSQDFFKQAASETLETLIDEALLIQEADNYKIKIPEHEIDAAIERLEKSNGKKKGYLKELTRTYGIPFNVIRKQLKAGLIAEMLRERDRPMMQVSKAELEARISQIESNRDKKHYKLAEIFIPSSAATDHAVMQQMAQISSYLNQGAPFSILAQQFSKASSKDNGGAIGWISESALKPDFKEAVAKLQKGRHSAVFKTTNGYYILMLMDVKNTAPELDGETAYSYIHAIYPLSTTASQDQIINVFNKCAQISHSASSPERFKELARGAGADVREIKSVNADEIPPVVADLLATLTPCKNEAGEYRKCKPSNPIRTAQGVFVFLMSEVHKSKSGELNRQKIENIIANEKLHQVAAKQIRDLRRVAHIDNRFKGSSSSSAAA